MKNISISFSLSAALTGGFKGAFQSAASSAKNVASAIRDMEKTPVGNIGRTMAQQREKIRGLAGSLKEAKATLATLQSQAQASGGATGMLARQIELAGSRVNNLNGAMTRQLGIWRNTTAQAATTGGSVRRLANDYDRLSQRIERARKVQAAMAANRAQGDALRAQRADLNGRLTGAVAAATTVAAPVALSIGFEDQMAKVGAVSRASKEDLALLTDQARQLGRDTSFSASQAAQGMQYLAMAGFKTNQVMAAMPGMLDLAAASGTDLGQTANIASNILSAFGLKAEEMGHVGDVLVAAFTSSNTTLESLGETMKYVGPVAKDAGASIEDAVAMAAMLGNVGISGSMAGTTSKSIFARLAAPPSEAVKALNALNIKTKDAQGNLRAVPDLLEEITLKTAAMGTADRTDVFSKIFGLEPMAGASALAKQAAQTVDENGRQIVDSMGKPTTALLQFTDNLKHASDNIDGMGGTSSRVAKQMNATTAGSLRILSSAWQDAGIEVGNLFLPAIRMAAGALSTIANVISATVSRFPMLSKGIALVVGGVIALTAAGVFMGLVMNFVRSGLNGFRGGLLRISAASVAATASTTASTVATGAFGIASRIAGAGAKFFAGGLRSILMATGVGALLVGLGFAINLLIDNWDAVVAAMSQAWAWVTDTWSRLGTFFSALGSNLAGIWPGIWANVCQVASDAKASFISIWEDVSGWFSALLAPVSAVFASLWDGVCSLTAWAYDAVGGIWSGAVEFFTGLASSISAAFAWAANGIGAAFAWARDAVTGIWQGIAEFFVFTGQGISDCFSGVWLNIENSALYAWDAITGIWNGAVEFFTGIVDGIYAVFQPVFDWFREKFAWVLGAIDTIKSAASSVMGAITGAFSSAFGGGDKKDETAAKAASGEKSAAGATARAQKDADRKAIANILAPPSAAPNARNAQAAPKYEPVSADAYHAAFEGKNDGAKGGKKKSSGGSSRSRSGASAGGSRSRSGAAAGGEYGTGAGSNPVTVVTLDSGNEIRTQFIPASRNASSVQTNGPNVFGENAAANANRVQTERKPAGGMTDNLMRTIKSSGIGGIIGQGLQAGTAMLKSVFDSSENPYPRALPTAGQPALPQAPAMIAKKRQRKDQTPGMGSAAQRERSENDAFRELPMSVAQDVRPNGISIDLTQNFDLITSDATAARKVLEAIKPDMEALIRRALEKIRSDRRRTSYAQ